MPLPEQMANAFSTTLALDCQPSDTTIHVNSVAPASLQTGQFRVEIDGEYLLVTGGAATSTWTVVRGSAVGETPTPVPAFHAANTPVYHYLTAASLDTRYGRVGTDGLIGGPGGTGLSASILTVSSENANAPVSALVSTPYSGGTSLVLDRPLGVAGRTYIAVGVGTTSCEIATVDSISGNTLTLDGALAGAHAANARVVAFATEPVPVAWFGVVGDGATDDTVALQQAAAQAGSLGLALDGIQRLFKVSAPVLVPTESRLRRMRFAPTTGFAPADYSSSMLMHYAGIAGAWTSSAANGGTIVASPAGMTAGSGVAVKGTMVAGLVAGRHYFATNIVGGTSFQLATTVAKALAGVSDVTFGAGGSGTYYPQVFSNGRVYIYDVFFDCSSVVGVNGFGVNTQQPAHQDKLRCDNQLSMSATLVAGASAFDGTARYWKVVATDSYDGSTWITAERTATPSNAQQVQLKWITHPSSTVTYSVYRSTTPDGQGTSPALVVSGLTANTYTDTGSAVSAGSTPATSILMGFGLWLSAIQMVFHNFESHNCDNAIAAEAAIAVWWYGFDIESNGETGVFAYPAHTLAPATGAGLTQWSIFGAHHEGLTKKYFDLTYNGAPTGGNLHLQIAGVWLEPSAPTGGATHSYIYAPSGANYIIQGGTGSLPSSSGFKVINDGVFGVFDGWDDFHQTMPPEINAATTPRLGTSAAWSKVILGKNGRYLKFGGPADVTPSIDSRPSSSQSVPQAIFRDTAGLERLSLSLNGSLGGLGYKRRAVVNVDATALGTDTILAYTSITAARVVTLPDATVYPEKVLIVKDESGSCSATKTITLTPVGGQTIDGAGTLVLNSARATTCIYSNGTNWAVYSIQQAAVTPTIPAPIDIVILDGANASATGTIASAITVYPNVSSGRRAFVAADLTSIVSARLIFNSDSVTSPYTLSITAVNTTTGNLTITGHGLTAGQPVGLGGTTLPTGFSKFATYFVLVVDANTIQLALAPGGTAIVPSTTGTSVTLIPVSFAVQYSTDQSTWKWFDGSAGTSGIPVGAVAALTGTTGVYPGPWYTPAAGVNADQFFRLISYGGNGTVNPDINGARLQVK